jgi:type II secretory pathway pseudopilin PulG
MLFNLKKQKGSTIVEVIISVIIIGIVSVYGMSFFASAYKHARDSKDYSFILHDLLRKMEIVRGSNYPGASREKDYRPLPITSGNDEDRYDFLVDKVLRNNCKVHYTCSVFVDSGTINDNFDNSTKVVVAATWPWPEDEHAYADADKVDKNEIFLVTYMTTMWPLDTL